MDQTVLKVLKKVGFTDESVFDDSYFLEMTSNKDTNTVHFNWFIKRFLSYSNFYSLLECFNNYSFKTKVRFSFDFVYPKDISFSALVDNFIEEVDKECLIHSYNFLYENDLVFFYKEDNKEAFDKLISSFKIYVKDLCLEDKINVKVSLYKSPESTKVTEDKLSELEDDLDFLDDEIAELSSDSEQEAPKKRVFVEYIDEEEAERLNKEYYDEHQNKARELGQAQIEKEKQARMYFETVIRDCYQFEKIQISGEVFKSEISKTKKGKYVIEIFITDFTSSISFKIFENNKFTIDFMNSIYNGMMLNVKGRFKVNDFTKKRELYVTSLTEIPGRQKRQDCCSEKRVELHLHSNMSTMDGVCSIDKFVKRAKEFGMSAIGLTDHGGVQAYPKFQQALKKHCLKGIYGCELYMVEDSYKYIFNPRDVELKNAKYVVLDIETTGLSCRYDHIIEFGAVVYDKGKKVESVDFFIKTKVVIDDKIRNLTHISDSMIATGLHIKEALLRIKELCKDAIIVAHNASFDFNFINEAFKNSNMEILDNPVIDTLPLFRYLQPELKRHNLGSLCRSYDVKYNEEEAHRANFDAEVLYEAFKEMIDEIIRDKHINSHKDIAKLDSTGVIFNSMPHHVTAYAKNSEGLKDLFEIISISNTEYFKGNPRVTRSLLESKRKNLILGSACVNGEVFEAVSNSNEATITTAMTFYDFIEVQPPGNYIFKVNEKKLPNVERIHSIIKDIIYFANKLNKKVVATGDVHYVDPEDKIFRDIMISAKGLQGVRHPLNPFERSKLAKYENPDQHFFTTDEMLYAFKFLDDDNLAREIVVKNSNYIASLCDEVKPLKDKLYTPTIEHCADKVLKMVHDNAVKMYGDPIPQIIQERLDAELKGITENNYFVIYYIAHKLVTLTNEQGYLVGSRGSVGSSLVATMCGITEVNPLAPHYVCPKCHHLEWADLTKYQSGYDLPDKECPHCKTKMKADGQNIPFATFLGFKAEKVPDIDLNFPSDFQSKAHDMTKDLLGEKNVFKAGTIETIKDKTAYGYVLAYFESLGINTNDIAKAELDRLSGGITGIKRTTGQHPGGIIVIPNELQVYDFTPIQYPADKLDSKWMTTHFDFNSIHDNVLKLDILGHLDPYVLRVMQDFTGIQAKDVPLNDVDVISLFYSPKALKLQKNILNESTGALGLPEFGSNLGRKTLLETQPRTFDDLVRISGLSHGEGVYQGNAREFILDGKGTLKDVIGCRDDIMTRLADIYDIPAQEGFKLMEVVRKGKYLDPNNAELREKYNAMMREHNVPESFIESCEKIKYLFPKGHAVAYCMMAVRVGWYKLYQPLAYYAAFLSIRSDAWDIQTMVKGKDAILAEYTRLMNARRSSDTGKLDAKSEAILTTLSVSLEMYDRGISFAPIDVNECDATFFKYNKETNQVIPSLSSIDGIGENSAKSIVEERNKNGRFHTIEEFNKRTGAGDSLTNTLRNLDAFKNIHESNQMSLFDDF